MKKLLTDISEIRCMDGKEKLYRLPTYKMTREEVKTEIFRYVFIYYNRIRICTSNPYGLSPEKYRKEIESKQQLKKAA